MNREFDLFDISRVQTPCYVVCESLLEKNMQIIENLKSKCTDRLKVLLAQKAFSMYETYPLLAKTLDGTTASGLFEARLGFEEFGGQTHVYAPAFKTQDMQELVKIADHIVFNSFAQLKKHLSAIKESGREISVGIRVNPLYSETSPEIYNPCGKYSRLGVLPEDFKKEILENPNIIDCIDGLHFHTMCEQNSDALKKTLEYVEKYFGEYLYKLKWINFGGGHHITRDDYDLNTLAECVNYTSQKYDVDIYIEPGEAIALNAGYLVSEVMQTGYNEINLAILDASAACHMPDVLEMPYTPRIVGADKSYSHKYRLGSCTCLAGDIIGDYSFENPLKEGDRLVFEDMAIYSMCKNNTFNGIPLPNIYLAKSNGELKLVKSFGYEDFKARI